MRDPAWEQLGESAAEFGSCRAALKTENFGAVIDSNPLLCRPPVRAPQHAATNSVGGAEETFRRVHALLSRGLQTAPICSPVSSHAALAKCQETEYMDRFGHPFRIQVHGPVCENAAPGFGSSEAIDDNVMGKWPY
jgi:hypothetical protein